MFYYLPPHDEVVSPGNHMFQVTQSIQLLSSPTTPLGGTTTPITNAEVADVLFNIATLLEMHQDNPYRIQAYRNAARGALMIRDAIAAIVAGGARLEWPGLGDRLRRKIAELASTGRMTFYDELCESSLPPDARALLAVRHVGPKTALRLVEVLDIHSVQQLLAAAESHRVRGYYGFGTRSEQRLGDAARAALETHGAAA